MRWTPTTALALLLAARSVCGAVVLTEGFEEPGSWRKTVKGKGAVELVPGGVEGKCLKVTSEEQAFAYYSRQLDVQRVRGKRLIVRAKVKLDNVVTGPEVYSTAKLHVGVMVGQTMQHRAQRFVGTRDWHDQVLVAPVPENADRVVLDLGIQNGTGTAWFDSLVVDDGVKEHVPLSLKPVANASFGGAVLDGGGTAFTAPGGPDLRGIPVADVRLAGIDFYVMRAQENFGRTCVALRGAARPQLPARTEAVVAVNAKGSRLLFLQAAIGVDPQRKAPCLVYTVRYADGRSVDVPMREGIDLGALDDPSDLANWKAAWCSAEGGRRAGLGVTAWRNPRPDAAIAWIRLSTPGTGAVPVVVAVSLDPGGGPRR